MAKQVPSYLNFDHSTYKWKQGIDYRKEPEKYKVGKGEQGVLTCEPYKTEIVQYWCFKTPDMAKESSKKIYQMFLDYLNVDDFIGADMARKFLQMGFTRARRYANYKGGLKYDKITKEPLEKGTGDSAKAESATIFFILYKKAEENKQYAKLKEDWKKKHG